MAKELVTFADKHALAPDGKFSTTVFSSELYPLLAEHVCKIRLYGTGSARCSWTCGTISVAMVRVVESHIKESIELKAGKAGQYDWKGAEEKWLLIHASGYPIASNAGPHSQSVDWVNSGLVYTAEKSGFDRVFFWDRANGWCKPIWPAAPMIRKRELRDSA